MLERKVPLGKEKIPELLELIKDFAKRGEYVLEEVAEESGRKFTIYDRRTSGALFNMMEVFLGNYMMPERIRITVNLNELDDGLEVNLRGDVMMNLVNVVNDRPKRRDVLRCEYILEILLQKISGLAV